MDALDSQVQQVSLLAFHCNIFAAQSLRLAFLELREKVQETCESFGSLPQTSTERSDLPEEGDAAYEV